LASSSASPVSSPSIKAASFCILSSLRPQVVHPSTVYPLRLISQRVKPRPDPEASLINFGILPLMCMACLAYSSSS
jgi:hypothetical protein